MSPDFPTDCPQPSRNIDLDDVAIAPPSLEEAWRAVCETLQQRLSAHTYTTYVAKAKLLGSSRQFEMPCGTSRC